MQNVGDAPHYTNVTMPFEEFPPSIPATNPTGVYRSTFDADPAWARRRVILHVGAAESVLIVELNGVQLAVSKDSHLAAEVDVTDHLLEHGNELVLTVIKWSDASFIEDQDQWWHGGITQSVSLFSTPTTYLADVHTVADFDADSGTGTLTVDVELDSRDPLASGSHVVRVRANGQSIDCTVAMRNPRQGPGAGMVVPAVLREMDLSGLRSGLAAGVPVPAEIRAAAMPLAAAMFPAVPRRATLKLEFADIAAWTAETPSLHEVSIELLGTEEEVVDQTRIRVGFRRVQIVGKDLLINGQRIWVQGVNRHDFHPQTGRTLNREQIADDLIVLKRHNVNAIRTAHYPPHPALLDLADEFGFYVIDEADIEGHDYADTLSADPRYLSAFVDRVSRMVLRDKNHPSVIAWSLGNETSSGPNQSAAAGWVRGYDSTRPVHYEGAIAADWYVGHAQTDIVCPMYPSLEALRAYGVDPRADRPLIMSEYQHAMGNSNGSFTDYWDVVRSTPGVQGGFIWEMRDHGLDPDGDGRYRMGGDFGEEPNDGNFCLDGLLAPDGTPHPAMFEVRHAWAPLRISGSPEDVAVGIVRVRNERTFTGLEDLRISAQAVSSSEVGDGIRFRIPAVAPGETVEIGLPSELLSLVGSETLAIRFTVTTAGDVAWGVAGTELSVQQVVLREPALAVVPVVDPAEPSTPTDSLTVDADGILVHPLLTAGPSVSLWRAPTDNDNARLVRWRFEASGLHSITRELLGITSNSDNSQVTVRARLHSATGHVIEHVQTITAESDGARRFEERIEIPPAITDLLRIGMVFATAPGFDNASWLGDGPHESYPDRRSSALLGPWSSPVSELAGPYIKPQENGGRSNVTRAALTRADGARLALASSVPVQFNASHTSAAELAAKRHNWELQSDSQTWVHLDVAHRGLGTASCGPDTLQRYRVGPGSYTWTWWLGASGSERS